METRNLGIIRALGWERTPAGIEFQCVTELLAAARVAVSAVAPRIVRVRTTAGPMAAAKRFSYVVGRPDAGPWSIEEGPNRVTLRTARVVVEATLDPWQLTFRTPDGRLLTHQVSDDTNFAGHRFGPRPGFVYARPWVRRPYYGRFVAGVALGTIITVAAVGLIPPRPAPDLCWYWADPYRYRGYWDYCY